MAFEKTKNNVVLFTQGAPLPANAVTMTSAVILKPDVKSTDIEEIGDGTLGSKTSYVDEQHTTVSFDIEVMARGNDSTGAAPDTPPAISKMLLACGLLETIDSTLGLENVIYTPSSADVAASTAKVYLDGQVRTVTGIRSDFKISGAVGEAAKFNFSHQGYTTPAPAAEANPAVTLDGNDRLIVKKISGATIDGATVNMQSFSLEMNNDVSDVYAVGVAEFERTDFDPKLSVEALKTKGNNDAWNDFINGQIREIIITLGTGAGKTLTITASNCRAMDHNEDDDNGKMKESRSYRCEKNTVDDHFSIKWS